MTKFDPKAIFNSADSFYEGAKIILKSAEKSMADPKQQTFRLPILPVITNMAFSLELYVKCLLVIEGKSPKQIHHIYKLYTKLSDKTKNELSKKISQWQQFGD
jgi:hypothetical protein